MDELLEQFLIEARDLTAQATQDLALLARDPGDMSAIDSAFRAFHTLKGSVAIFGLAPAERLLHAAEDRLEQARRRVAQLDSATIAGLEACLDQTDRWIDQMEIHGRLADDAPLAAGRAIALLDVAPLSSGVAISPDQSPQVGPDWLTALRSRHAAVLAEATGPLVAFRYAPDPDCFFRGDDPFATITAIPETKVVAILPADGDWPTADEIEPFRCYCAFEGLSASPLGIVQGVFRLMPDQVELIVIDAGEKASDEHAQPALDRSVVGSILRVDAARLDTMADALGELIVAINALAPLAEEAGRADTQLGGRLRQAQAQLERVTGQLNRTVTSVRSVPIEPALRRLPRLARELAEALGKRVTFSMATGGLEVDKQIADALFEPLLHLVRNAIDHGIEHPADRETRGKSGQGEVSLDIRRDGDMLTVTLEDDGGGIDPRIIRQVAVMRKLIAPDEAEALADRAALQLIFLAGFSTAGAVTGTSGRGVGMDAVQAAVQKLRGTIDVTSVVGQGTAFRIRLPAHSLTTRLLVVEVGQERYGIVLDQVAEMARIANDALIPVGHGTACVLRGRTVPVLSLATLLGERQSEADHARLLVTHMGGEPVALRVDGFAQRVDTVVRPASRVLEAVPGISGSALLGNGDVLLVLDLAELVA